MFSYISAFSCFHDIHHINPVRKPQHHFDFWFLTMYITSNYDVSYEFIYKMFFITVTSWLITHFSLLSVFLHFLCFLGTYLFFVPHAVTEKIMWHIKKKTFEETWLFPIMIFEFKVLFPKIILFFEKKKHTRRIKQIFKNWVGGLSAQKKVTKVNQNFGRFWSYTLHESLWKWQGFG